MLVVVLHCMSVLTAALFPAGPGSPQTTWREFLGTAAPHTPLCLRQQHHRVKEKRHHLSDV